MPTNNLNKLPFARAKRIHPYQWLWEPLELDAGFILRPMFGGKAAYIDGLLSLYFSAKEEPWRGILVCTSREHHKSLIADFADLTPHPILPKWLYLPETSSAFEKIAAALVTLAAKRDHRLGVKSSPKKKRTDGSPRQKKTRKKGTPGKLK